MDSLARTLRTAVGSPALTRTVALHCACTSAEVALHVLCGGGARAAAAASLALLPWSLLYAVAVPQPPHGLPLLPPQWVPSVALVCAVASAFAMQHALAALQDALRIVRGGLRAYGVASFVADTASEQGLLPSVAAAHFVADVLTQLAADLHLSEPARALALCGAQQWLGVGSPPPHAQAQAASHMQASHAPIGDVIAHTGAPSLNPHAAEAFARDSAGG